MLQRNRQFRLHLRHAVVLGQEQPRKARRAARQQLGIAAIALDDELHAVGRTHRHAVRGRDEVEELAALGGAVGAQQGPEADDQLVRCGIPLVGGDGLEGVDGDFFGAFDEEVECGRGEDLECGK
jgi:hypothetical protein